MVKECRSLSTSGNLQVDRGQNLPRPIIQRQLSNPITNNEKTTVFHQHNSDELRNNTQNQIQNEIKSQNPQYDIIGMYPPVKKLIAIGDLHGDFNITLIALKLGSYSSNINRRKFK